MKHSSDFLRLVEDAKTRIKEISPQTLLEFMDKKTPFTLIDVREDSEWLSGHLPNALHISRGILERDIEKKLPDKKTSLILYCGGGYRSALAADSLIKMGYQNILSLSGGVRVWKELEFPITKE